MSRYFSSAWFLSFPLWIVLSLFSIPAGAVNPPGSYGGAAIAAGEWHTVALKNDGTVWTWGRISLGSWESVIPPTARFPSPSPLGAMSSPSTPATGGAEKRRHRLGLGR